jgi:hypothetical protein
MFIASCYALPWRKFIVSASNLKHSGSVGFG